MQPSTPKNASHQMCQIIAKPVTTAKKARTKPIAVVLRQLDGLHSRACAADPA